MYFFLILKMNSTSENHSEVGKEDTSMPQGSVEYLRSLIEDPSWRRVLSVEFQKEYMNKIAKFLQTEKEKVIFKMNIVTNFIRSKVLVVEQ